MRLCLPRNEIHISHLASLMSSLIRSRWADKLRFALAVCCGQSKSTHVVRSVELSCSEILSRCSNTKYRISLEFEGDLGGWFTFEVYWKYYRLSFKKKRPPFSNNAFEGMHIIDENHILKMYVIYHWNINTHEAGICDVYFISQRKKMIHSILLTEHWKWSTTGIVLNIPALKNSKTSVTATVRRRSELPSLQTFSSFGWKVKKPHT